MMNGMTEEQHREKTYQMQKLSLFLQVLGTAVVLYIGWLAVKKEVRRNGR